MSWTNGSDYDAENDTFLWDAPISEGYDGEYSDSQEDSESEDSDSPCTIIVNGTILEHDYIKETQLYTCQRDDWPGNVLATFASEDEEIEVYLVHAYSTRRRVYFTFEEVGYYAEEEGSEETVDEYGPNGYLAFSE